jgi:hypothetical protein
VKDRSLGGRGWDCGDRGENPRGREFLDWDFLIQDEGFERWVLKGREGGPIFFLKLLVMEGFLG